MVISQFCFSDPYRCINVHLFWKLCFAEMAAEIEPVKKVTFPEIQDAFERK